MVANKTAVATVGCYPQLTWQLAPTVDIETTATADRLATHTYLLCAVKPSKWIVLLHLSHILLIIISVILNNAHITMHYDGIQLKP